MPFVVDNSVVSAWFLKEQATPYTTAVLDRLAYDRAHVPALWSLELANVARIAIAHGKFDRSQAQQAVEFVTQLPIAIDRQALSPADLLALALRFNLTAYDAAHLELAMRLELPIAAKDGAFRAAAQTAGVGIFRAEAPSL